MDLASIPSIRAYTSAHSHTGVEAYFPLNSAVCTPEVCRASAQQWNPTDDGPFVMYICIYMYIYTYIHTHTHHTHTHTHTHTCIGLGGLVRTQHIYTYMYIHSYVYIYLHIRWRHQKPSVSQGLLETQNGDCSPATHGDKEQSSADLAQPPLQSVYLDWFLAPCIREIV
jgi:hypothetical protein